jgi:hypothetical protein
MQRQPLFLRLGYTETGALKFAGQSWQTNETLEWEFGKGWKILPGVTGVSPVIYDKNNNLITKPFVYPDGSVCSQGWRFVDEAGRLWNGDETYGPSSRAPKMYEWTDLTRGNDKLSVGQGDEDGILFWDGSVRRQFKSGRCRFVRAHRAEVAGVDAISVGYYYERGGLLTSADPTFLSREEINSLPIVDLNVQTIARLPRPIWTGYIFSMSDRYGDNPSAPGSMQVVLEPAAVRRAVALGMKVIVPANYLDLVPSNQLVAVDATGATVEEVEASIMAAKTRMRQLGIQRPIMSYLDKDDWPRLPNPQPDWYCPQAYCKANETFPNFRTRITNVMKKFPADKKIVLMCQAYNTNTTLTSDLLPLQYVFPELARQDARVNGIIWFSDGREDLVNKNGGTRYNSFIRPAHVATVAASPGIPAFETVVVASVSSSRSKSPSASPSASPSIVPVSSSPSQSPSGSGSASPSASTSGSPSASPSTAPPEPRKSWWDKVVRFFRNLFR